MRRAIIKYHYIVLTILTLIELVLLTVMLKPGTSYHAFSVNIALSGLAFTALWLIFVAWTVKGIRPHSRHHLAVDFTQHRSVFGAVVVCLAFLLTWSVLFIIAITSAPVATRMSRDVNTHFEHIRKDSLLLTEFYFNAQRGDLHHHFSGSVYGKTYWEMLTEDNGWINMVSLEVDTPGAVYRTPWKLFAQVQSEKCFDSLKRMFLRKESIEYFHNSNTTGNQYFFAKFPEILAIATFRMQKGLQELKLRASRENVQYIEIMIWLRDTSISLSGPYHGKIRLGVLP